MAHVQLDMTLLNPLARYNERVQKPFESTPGFDTSWWVFGYEKGPVVWCTVTDAARGEVARAQVRLASRTGAAYPTWRIPATGATEIERLEVRTDLQRSGLRIGSKTLALIREEFPAPFFALSLDTHTDGFWRHVRWREHDHAEAATARADGRPLPAQLFAIPE